MRTSTERERSKRVEVRLHRRATAREQRELGAFVRFCVARMERDGAAVDRWIVTIAPDPREGFTCTVVSERGGARLEIHAIGRDGTLAAWNGLTEMEQALREHAGCAHA